MEYVYFQEKGSQTDVAPTNIVLLVVLLTMYDQFSFACLKVGRQYSAIFSNAT